MANAVGFAARGDTIEVSNMAFGENDIPAEPNAAELLAQFAERMGRPLLIAFISFLFIMLVVRPVVLAPVRPKVEAGKCWKGLEGLPAAEEQYALYEAQEQEARAAEENARALSESGEDGGYGLESGLSLDDIKARALQLAERNIEQTVYVIRSWMKEGVRN